MLWIWKMVRTFYLVHYIIYKRRTFILTQSVIFEANGLMHQQGQDSEA